MQISELPLLSADEWSAEADARCLYHGTSSKHRQSILRDGFGPGCHWGSEAIARYFAARECEEKGGQPIVFALPLERFDETLLAPDDAMAEFPIFDDYDVRAIEWEEIEEAGNSPTWQDSLRVYHSVVYGGPVRPSAGDILGAGGQSAAEPESDSPPPKLR